MEIIDTHVHIWNFAEAEYEWLKNDTSILNRNYDIEELQVDLDKTASTERLCITLGCNNHCGSGSSCIKWRTPLK